MSGVPADILDLLAKNYSSKPEDKLTASELAQLKQLRAETAPDVWETYLAAGKAERKRRKKLAKSQPSAASHRSQTSPKHAMRQPGAGAGVAGEPAVPSSSVDAGLSARSGAGASPPMWPTASDAGFSPASQAQPSLPSGSSAAGSPPSAGRGNPGMHWPAAHMEISSSSSEPGADRGAALAQQRGRTRHSVGSIASARSLPSASSSVVQGHRFASSTRSSRAKSKDVEPAAPVPVAAKPSIPRRSHTPSSVTSQRSHDATRARPSSAARPVRSRLMAPTAASVARVAATAEPTATALPRSRQSSRYSTPVSRPQPAAAAATPALSLQANAARSYPSSRIRRGQGTALASAPTQPASQQVTPPRAAARSSSDAIPAPSPGAISAGLHSVSAAARAVLQNLQGVNLSQARVQRAAPAPPLGPPLHADGAEPGRPTSPWGTSALVKEGVLVLTPQRVHAEDSRAMPASAPDSDQLGQVATPPSKASPTRPSPLAERLRQLHLQASAVRSQHLAVATHVQAQFDQFQQALNDALGQVREQQQQQQQQLS